ncbi:hypothetical protein FH972_024699 [Carpinus fangiana]|uniref:Uncharacterized protein n=1 Tax=Carpinus fangiana TaxID=176857 RepID=A0A5N6KYR6_9ROSI|nr:hypothetical protein FH972_024699 [Carpinus fangiana]
MTFKYMYDHVLAGRAERCSNTAVTCHWSPIEAFRGDKVALRLVVVVRLNSFCRAKVHDAAFNTVGQVHQISGNVTVDGRDVAICDRKVFKFTNRK